LLDCCREGEDQPQHRHHLGMSSKWTRRSRLTAGCPTQHHCSPSIPSSASSLSQLCEPPFQTSPSHHNQPFQLNHSHTLIYAPSPRISYLRLRYNTTKKLLSLCINMETSSLVSLVVYVSET